MRRRHVALAFSVLFFSWLGCALAQRAVVVVRHAEKISDSDERLSDDGLARAARLAVLLKGAQVSAIYSTDTERTRGTAQPLADSLKLPVRIYDTGAGERVDAKPFVAMLRAKHANDVVLVVGHSNTVPEILRALGCAEPVAIASGEYDNLFIVVPAGGKATLVRLKY